MNRTGRPSNPGGRPPKPPPADDTVYFYVLTDHALRGGNSPHVAAQARFTIEELKGRASDVLNLVCERVTSAIEQAYTENPAARIRGVTGPHQPLRPQPRKAAA